MSVPQLEDLIKMYPIDRWVFWVGAGVSVDSPSSLPLGIPLTKTALEECCGPRTCERVNRLWTALNESVATTANRYPLGIMPRLESVLGDIDDVRDHARGPSFDFLRGFQSFVYAPFNSNHLAIADLCSRGATVVTTNFDTCIERSRGNAHVHHIHGTVSDLRNFGATIRSVKQGLSSETSALLDNLFSSPRLIIFLGYSASDSFDVNLYFGRKKESEFQQSAAAFIQHPGADVPANAKLLLWPFGVRWSGIADTSKFLQHLAPTSDRSIAHGTFDWKQRFLESALLADIPVVRSYLICKLAFTLGIDVSLLDPDAYEKALKTQYCFEPLNFHKTLAYVCRIRGESSKEKGHDLAIKATAPDLLGYHYAHGNLRRALKYSYSLDQIVELARGRNAELDWRTYTSMAVHCRLLLTKYLRNPFLRRLSTADQHLATRILELSELLSNVEFKNVRFVIQVATALRFGFLLRALLSGIDDRRVIDEILMLYGEASSVAGFVSTYRDVAIKDFFLYRYHNHNKMDEARDAITKSYQLAKIVGDATSMTRARKMSLYFKIVQSLVTNRT